jgi:peptidyl-prolyl cis-trans isomerase SurA
MCTFFINGWMAAQALPDNSQALDKVVAVVGKEIVLQSDVEGRLAMFLQQNPALNAKDKEIRRKVLDALINERLMVTKAIEDSIVASDEEINQSLEYMMQNLVQTYGSERRVEDIYGMPVSRIRRNFREEVRKQLLVEKLQQQKFSAVKCSSREVEEFYRQNKDSIPRVPPQVELAHIVKVIQASTDAKEEVLRMARRVRDSIIAGGDFAAFAKKYSGDPGSAVSGGDLGWIDKGKLVPEYERAAYALQAGETSQPVETPFGYHIIQTLDKRKDAVQTRHILFKIGGSGDDQKRAKQALLDIRERIVKGEKFEDVARQTSDEKETQGFGGSMGVLELSRLPADLRTILEKLPEGGVSEPLPYMSDPTKPALHIIQKKKEMAEHIPSLEADYKRIEQMAASNKQNRLIEEWLQTLRRTIYWEYRE